MYTELKPAPHHITWANLHAVTATLLHIHVHPNVCWLASIKLLHVSAAVWCVVSMPFSVHYTTTAPTAKTENTTAIYEQ